MELILKFLCSLLAKNGIFHSYYFFLLYLKTHLVKLHKSLFYYNNMFHFTQTGYRSLGPPDTKIGTTVVDCEGWYYTFWCVFSLLTR